MERRAPKEAEEGAPFLLLLLLLLLKLLWQLKLLLLLNLLLQLKPPLLLSKPPLLPSALLSQSTFSGSRDPDKNDESQRRLLRAGGANPT